MKLKFITQESIHNIWLGTTIGISMGLTLIGCILILFVVDHIDKKTDITSQPTVSPTPTSSPGNSPLTTLYSVNFETTGVGIDNINNALQSKIENFKAKIKELNPDIKLYVNSYTISAKNGRVSVTIILEEPWLKDGTVGKIENITKESGGISERIYKNY